MKGLWESIRGSRPNICRLHTHHTHAPPPSARASPRLAQHELPPIHGAALYCTHARTRSGRTRSHTRRCDVLLIGDSTHGPRDFRATGPRATPHMQHSSIHSAHRPPPRRGSRAEDCSLACRRTPEGRGKGARSRGARTPCDGSKGIHTAPIASSFPRCHHSTRADGGFRGFQKAEKGKGVKWPAARAVARRSVEHTPISARALPERPVPSGRGRRSSPVLEGRFLYFLPADGLTNEPLRFERV